MGSSENRSRASQCSQSWPSWSLWDVARLEKWDKPQKFRDSMDWLCSNMNDVTITSNCSPLYFNQVHEWYELNHCISIFPFIFIFITSINVDFKLLSKLYSRCFLSHKLPLSISFESNSQLIWIESEALYKSVLGWMLIPSAPQIANNLPQSRVKIHTISDPLVLQGVRYWVGISHYRWGHQISDQQNCGLLRMQFHCRSQYFCNLSCQVAKIPEIRSLRRGPGCRSGMTFLSATVQLICQ
jgi:hypothetical protein